MVGIEYLWFVIFSLSRFSVFSFCIVLLLGDVYLREVDGLDRFISLRRPFFCASHIYIHHDFLLFKSKCFPLFSHKNNKAVIVSKYLLIGYCTRDDHYDKNIEFTISQLTSDI